VSKKVFAGRDADGQVDYDAVLRLRERRRGLPRGRAVAEEAGEVLLGAEEGTHADGVSVVVDGICSLKRRVDAVIQGLPDRHNRVVVV
jgi:hypothetical protein